MSENTAKGWQGNFFEDFELGQTIACPTPRRVGEGETAAYIGLTGDRTPRFCNEDRVLHPLMLFHTSFGQTVRQISLNARANLGYADWVWRRPVRTATVLHTNMEIIGLKENSSGKTGVVYVKNRARDVGGELVCEYTRWVMIKKRGSAPTRWASDPVVPELPSVVDTSRLRVDRSDLPKAAHTGGQYYFEDYVPGERVVHHDGQTVNPSDHMAFTRLFQNSAKIHFDAQLTEGKPLVYGGFPMSVGYAQAYNGFENRLGLAAVNGGVHANPVYAGDTLYSMTVVDSVDPLGAAPAGAVRCKLYVFKNFNPATDPDIALRDEKGKLIPSVALELDFWELITKRAAI